MMYVSDALASLGACPEAIEWVRARRGMPGGLRATWEACERGDWLIWLARRVSIDDRTLRLIVCDCADRALLAERERGREPDPRSWESVRVSREYAEGRAPSEAMRAAPAAAYAAYAAAYAAPAAERKAQASIVRRHVRLEDVLAGIEREAR